MTSRSRKPPKKRRRKPPHVVGSRTAAFFGQDPRIDDRLMAAFEKALARYAHRPDVTGIDVGIKMKGGKHTQRMAVRIHVREKVEPRHVPVATRFPKQIDGVPVDVIEAVYAAHVGPVGPPLPVASIRPGMSVGLEDGPTGTIGVIARDPANLDCVVSAAHVLAADGAQPGALIIQPGRDDGGQAANDVVGALVRINKACDAAYGILDGSRTVDRRALTSDIAVTGTRYPMVGDVLEKSGRSTGVTRAEVDGRGFYYGLQWAFRLVPLAGQTVPIAEEGDSGSVWYDSNTREGVGIHCKGGLLPVSTMNFAVATSLKVVLDEWGLVV